MSGNNKYPISQRLIKIFIRSAKNAIDTLNAQEPKHDMDAFITTIHGMRSALLYVGEKEVSEAAHALEKAAMDGNVEYINAHLEPFIKTLEVLCEKLCSKGDKSAINAESDEDANFLARQLEKIISALEAYDDTTVYLVLDLLDKMHWSTDTAASLSKIRDGLFLDSDFEGSAKRAAKLLTLIYPDKNY